MNKIKKVSNAGIYKGYLTGMSAASLPQGSSQDSVYFVDWPERFPNHVILIGNDDNIRIPNRDFIRMEGVEGEVYVDDRSGIYIEPGKKEESKNEEGQDSMQEGHAQMTTHGIEYAPTRKERIVRILYEKLEERRKFIDRVPSSMSTFIVDNEYTSLVEISLDAAIDCIFAHDPDSYVQWFFYEWKPGYKITTGATAGGGKVVYRIENIDDFIRYLHKETEVLAD